MMASAGFGDCRMEKGDSMNLEYFDVLKEDGTPAGTRKLREEVHRDGDWHGGSHIWVARKNGERTEILLQKRSEDKDSFPGCLDSSCAGHADAGETFLEAAVREMNEELGLPVKAQDLIFLFRQAMASMLSFHGKPFYNREFNDVYLLRMDFPLDTMQFQTEEISDLIWIGAEELLRDIRACDPQYCIWGSEYEKVYEAVCCLTKE